jgi:hypothetical protein
MVSSAYRYHRRTGTRRDGGERSRGTGSSQDCCREFGYSAPHPFPDVGTGDDAQAFQALQSRISQSLTITMWWSPPRSEACPVHFDECDGSLRITEVLIFECLRTPCRFTADSHGSFAGPPLCQGTICRFTWQPNCNCVNHGRLRDLFFYC